MTVSEQKHRKMIRLIQDHWNFRATRFDEEFVHGVHSAAQREAWLDLLARLAGDPPRRVLDVGCGTGVLTILLAELGHTVTGVDLAPRMLERAQQKARDARLAVQFRLENAAKLSDPDESYDLIVARHIVWTLTNPEQTISEWLRVLRSDGRLAVIEGQWWTDGPMAEPSPAQTRAVLGRLRAFLHTAGRAVSYAVRPAQWGTVLERQRDRRYQKAHTRLPLYGGPSAVGLRDLLEARGLREVVVEPLMESALWGEVPQHSRFLAVGRR